MKGLAFVVVVIGLFTAGCASPALNRASDIATASRVPIDDHALEGVWTDPSGNGLIAVIHKDGEEYRAVVAVGDLRSDIPLSAEIGTLPDEAARGRAAGALDAWREGEATPADRALYAMVGTKSGSGDQESVNGSWVEGNSPCTTERWGNWYVHMTGGDEPALYLSIYATQKKLGGGFGGQSYEFTRRYHLVKSRPEIKPGLLEKMSADDSFCRKTAAGS